MTLRLYNTATHKKDIFQPLEKGKVGIYVCGVTVYDLCHIGHARSTIVFDVLTRYLRAKGLDVTYVRNFTDVDDKIIERAKLLGKDTGSLAQEFIDAFYEDMGALRVLNADVEPRATEHIDGMIEMIEALIDRGHAYVEGTDVYFSVGRSKATAVSQGENWMICGQGAVLPWMTKRDIPWTLSCGKAQKRANLNGPVRGGRAGRAGTWSARS